MRNDQDPGSHPILRQVLQAIRLNRAPGFHFPGYFLGLSYEEVGDAAARVTLDTGAHCADPDGQMNVCGIMVLADLAMAGALRAVLMRPVRLATVNLSLQFTGAHSGGNLDAVSRWEGDMAHVSGRQGLSRATLCNEAGVICHGSGAFMIMPPPQGVNLEPLPLPKRGDQAEVPPLRPDELRDDERQILRLAEAALEADDASGFLSRFFGLRAQTTETGAQSVLQNGPHIANRVGHAQGGVMLAQAAVTASAALPPDWKLGAISACFLSPGEGEYLTAASHILHRGRTTAAIRTELFSAGGRRVLEVLSSHAAGAN